MPTQDAKQKKTHKAKCVAARQTGVLHLGKSKQKETDAVGYRMRAPRAAAFLQMPVPPTSFAIILLAARPLLRAASLAAPLARGGGLGGVWGCPRPRAGPRGRGGGGGRWPWADVGGLGSRRLGGAAFSIWASGWGGRCVLSRGAGGGAAVGARVLSFFLICWSGGTLVHTGRTQRERTWSGIGAQRASFQQVRGGMRPVASRRVRGSLKAPGSTPPAGRSRWVGGISRSSLTPTYSIEHSQPTAMPRLRVGLRT